MAIRFRPRGQARGTASDEELAGRTVAGDMEAFALLVERHQRRLYNVCLRVVRDADDAMDMTQDAFARIAERIDRFAGASSFATWSHRLTVNVCLDHLRRRKARPESAASDDLAVMEPVDTAPGPEETAVGRVDGAVLWEAVAALDEPSRLVIVLADVEGLSMEEVADALGIPVGTVKSRLHRARAKVLAAVQGRVEPPSARRVTRAAGGRPPAEPGAAQARPKDRSP